MAGAEERVAGQPTSGQVVESVTVGEGAARAEARRGLAWMATPWFPVLLHALRTAVAAILSLLVAGLFRLPETYWAAISTLVITQSSLGAALQISWERFIGTALGALVATAAASYFAPSLVVYGCSIFVLGIFCALVRSTRNAYRLGGVALTIVLLIPRTQPAWRVALHRFAEVSIGIAVALLLTVLWPDSEAPAPVANT